MQKIVVSWDVGIVNLAVSVIFYNSETDRKVVYWDLINTNIKNKGEKFPVVQSKLIAVLNNIKQKIIPSGLTAVIIESQQRSRKIMLTIQSTLIAFYLFNGVSDSIVRCMKSSAKFLINESDIMPKGAKNYEKRKNMAIDLCYTCIKHNEKLKKYFMCARKKDDLADSLLMALHFCNYKIDYKK